MNAAEIARLRAKVDAHRYLTREDVHPLLTALEQSQAALAEAEARIKELEEKVADREFAINATENMSRSNREDAVAWEAKVESLRARLEAAKEALKPFAEAADDELFEREPISLEIELNAFADGPQPCISLADLRRARAAIAEMEK